MNPKYKVGDRPWKDFGDRRIQVEIVKVIPTEDSTLSSGRIERWNFYEVRNLDGSEFEPNPVEEFNLLDDYS